MLKKVEWGKFKLGTLFDVKSNPQLNKDSFVFNENGEYPYFTRTVFNNGILGHVDYLDEEHKIAGNCLAVGMLGMQFFYMEKDFYAGQFTKRIIPKGFSLNENTAKFFTTVLNKLQKSFQNVLVRHFEDSFNNTEVVLPVKNGAVDFDFMDLFVSRIERERLNKLNTYLEKIKSDNCKLTAKERYIINDLHSIEWKTFNITDIFNIRNTRNILSEDIIPNSGSIPYLCASSENNSVSSYIMYDQKWIDEGNCIFIGGKTFVVSYQEKDFFSNDSHNLCLYLKEKEHRNKFEQLFIASCVIKSLKHKYSWGDSISKEKILKDKIKLPCINGHPNYEVMEILISAVQKLVIKDIVLYLKTK